ncbi:outer membrane protein [Luteibacter rhizovicinus]|uniref:Outer membrane protein n=2 Tax=Luteibacter rhizovicinus TaxID=242606 RepID=A0A4R3YTP2_9GAMM|nr:outer membrane protein [Luteibacter rhizovicinus]
MGIDPRMPPVAMRRDGTPSSELPLTTRIQQPLPTLAILLALAMIPARVAWADDATETQAVRWGWGVSAIAIQKPYRRFSPQRWVIPLLIYNSKWVSVYGPAASFMLPPTGPIAFAFTARLSRDGYRASDSPVLAGMAPRRDKFWMGGSATWRSPWMNVIAEWTGDVSGYSKAMTVSLTMERTFNYGRFQMTPRLAAISLDGKYTNYYFGVRPDEARPDRPAYRPGATVNVEAGMRAAWHVAPRDSVFVDAAVEHLGSEITRSPLVDTSTQSRLVVGYVHVF